jgi:hypothetical protein
MNRIVGLAIGLAAAFVARPGRAAEDAKVTEAALRAVVTSNFAASAAEDVNAVRATLHTQSPVFKSSLRACQQIFDYFDLKHELVSFRFLLADGEYAVARGEQKTTKLDGDDFKNNVMDCLFVFRQEAGNWRLWQQTVLETRYLK